MGSANADIGLTRYRLLPFCRSAVQANNGTCRYRLNELTRERIFLLAPKGAFQEV
jgi:hypothetical protein